MAQVQSRLNKAVKHLEYLYQTIDTTKKSLEILLNAGVTIDFTAICGHQNYIEKVKSNIRDQHKIISDIEIELEEKKQAVLEALKAKTMLEKLKEKALKEYKEAFEKLDLKEIDEIATNRQRLSASRI